MKPYKEIFSKSVSLWSQQDDTQNAIQNRLGWLSAPEFSRQHINTLKEFRQNVFAQGFKQVVLLGMGGSSLAPEVFNRFAKKTKSDNKLELIVLDGTCPAQIKTVSEGIDLSTTLFIVASKSGGTVETRFLFDYFFAKVATINTSAGSQFVAITDADSVLHEIAKRECFFAIFVNPSDIGGRYSALSFFGLVPAALLEWDIEKLLNRADQAVTENKAGTGMGVQLGEWLALNYEKPIDILFFSFESPELKSLFMWIEQLVAESLGKSGEGLLLAEVVAECDMRSANSKCLNLRFGEDDHDFSKVDNASIFLHDRYDVAAQFFHWQMATAIAAAHIGINPFDEPNVAEAKQKTSQLLSQPDDIVLPDSNRSVSDFLTTLSQSEYLALLVYAEDCYENRQEIQRIKTEIEKQIELPVTINFGPRYLHSVGQLHKGGKQHGAFLLLLDMPNSFIQIPGKSFGFEKLFCAQALGDFQILQQRGLPTEFITVESLADI